MSEKSNIPVKTQSQVANRPAAPDVFSSLRSEVDRVFEAFTRGWPTLTLAQDVTPRMDVAETDKDIEISAELPGLEEKDVQVNVADNVLTIKGEKKAEKQQTEKNYRLFERSYGSFYREVALPTGINADSIKATLSNGVLKVTIPKPAAAQAKKVEVKSAA